ncbi:MAG: hypothetical protein KKG06_05275, partial [Bacteroidetes bacterium]|nr:hypothetical protein [Bacteroidota bacterium]
LYWMEDVGYYSFGADENGNKVKDKSAYSTTGIALGIFDDKRSESTIKALNQSDMVTDWGIRNLTNKSSLYYHSNYNYGAVWPFTSIFVGWAQFNQNFNLSGYNTIQSTVQHLFENGLGLMPEVFSGDLNQKLGEAYHNQGFSYTGYIIPIMRGLLGLEVDANKKKITFAPKLPADWDFLEVHNIRVGENVINIECRMQNEERRPELVEGWKVVFEMKAEIKDEIDVVFTPSLGLGSKVDKVLLNGKEIKFKEVNRSQTYLIKTEFKLIGRSEFEIKLKPAPAIYQLPIETSIGSTDKGLKIISQEFRGKSLRIKVEGLSDEVYQLGIKHYKMVKRISGAELKGDKLFVHIPDENIKQFIEHEFVIEIAN